METKLSKIMAVLMGIPVLVGLVWMGYSLVVYLIALVRGFG